MQPDPNFPELRNFDSFTTPYLNDSPGNCNNAMSIGIALNDVRLLLDTRDSVERVAETLVHEMVVSQKNRW